MDDCVVCYKCWQKDKMQDNQDKETSMDEAESTFIHQ
jgi:hypothetical protein